MTLPGLSAARPALFRARYRVEAGRTGGARSTSTMSTGGLALVDLQMRLRLYTPVDLLDRRDAAGRATSSTRRS